MRYGLSLIIINFSIFKNITNTNLENILIIFDLSLKLNLIIIIHLEITIFNSWV